MSTTSAMSQKSFTPGLRAALVTPLVAAAALLAACTSPAPATDPLPPAAQAAQPASRIEISLLSPPSPAEPGKVITDETLRQPIPITVEYPAEALRAGITGYAELTVSYDAQGQVKRNPSTQSAEVFVRRSSGNRDLDRAALRAVRQATGPIFHPYTVNGQPQSGSTVLLVDFKLP